VDVDVEVDVDRAASAIADPVRREILMLLRDRPLAAGAIAARFTISRPAVSRHLRVLRETGLVVGEPRGRERVYRLDVTPLAGLDAWLAHFRGSSGSSEWGSRLDALETEVHRTRRDRVRGHSAATASSATPVTSARPDKGERTA
jgi:DNA-binding transcriptional ArsR family regulator